MRTSTWRMSHEPAAPKQHLEPEPGASPRARPNRVDGSPAPLTPMAPAPLARIMQVAITFSVLCLLLTACRHAEPERRSTEAQIRQHIAGSWTLSDKSEVPWFPKLIIAADGSLSGALSNGTTLLLGAWQCDGRMLRVSRTTATNEAARASAGLVNDWDFLPVIYVDEHELVMTRGISMAGRLRFTR